MKNTPGNISGRSGLGTLRHAVRECRDKPSADDPFLHNFRFACLSRPCLRRPFDFAQDGVPSSVEGRRWRGRQARRDGRQAKFLSTGTRRSERHQAGNPGHAPACAVRSTSLRTASRAASRDAASVAAGRRGGMARSPSNAARLNTIPRPWPGDCIRSVHFVRSRAVRVSQIPGHPLLTSRLQSTIFKP